MLFSKIKLKNDFRSYKRVNGRSERFKVSKSIYSPSATTLDFIAKPLTPTCQAQIDRKENENDGLPSSALGWKWKPATTFISVQYRKKKEEDEEDEDDPIVANNCWWHQ